ncbi:MULTISPECIES: branched-chain amino acid ABC transporter permease [unclassified Clostridium]|uniref:branched-chain amino acid ABC transporter permease n=1 Tax=unclassified Clostridium TaxID=2614128 RepID=UPI000297540C|nr:MULTISPECIES: branched-chain amino acid ABC transporter permease [unclassified Clostridium]EKQ51656.1 MAG: ABC-type branched-chain amino acid transport system, permease component [Clostridium sp. Maddingley MBC34-26]
MESKINNNEKNLSRNLVKSIYIRYLITTVVLVVIYMFLMFLVNQGIISDYILRIMKEIGIFLIAALGLNLILGFTGQFTMGHAAFMSIGAYGSAIMTKNFNMPLPVSLLVGIILSAILAALIGYPILRLKGDYLAICTLGFGEIVKVVIQNVDYLGGARGISAIPTKTSFLIVFLGVALCYAILRNLINSSKGRAIMSVREDEIAAEAMGINSTKYKMISFIIGSSMAGLAGGLYAHFNTFIDPASFNFSKSIELITYVVLGGMGSLSGTVLGTSILIYLPESLRGLSDVIKDYRMLIYALLLVMMMIFRPQGILGTREISIANIKKFIKKFKKSSSKNIEENAKVGE